MQNLLAAVLDNYVATRAKLNGLAMNKGTPDQKALLELIPDEINSYLVKHGLAHLYKVEGSIGDGNMARVPWVGVFDHRVTKSARQGFYIVLLFSEDMSSCYLSLNQGVTAVEDLYTKNFAWRKMRSAANRAAGYFDRHPESILNRIDLKSTGDLGRGYEAAAIESFLYNRADLPSQEVFFSHFADLLRHYNALIDKFGADLFALFEIGENEFQQVALEKASKRSDFKVSESAGGVEKSVATALGSRGFVRSPRVAAEAIRIAKFQCEIDPTHWTFTSRAKKMRYVEAHHLIPISQQHQFEFSLDVIANVISVCATCHRMLHYGTKEEKNSLLKKLLKSRRSALQEKQIIVNDRDFLQYYGDELELLEM